MLPAPVHYIIINVPWMCQWVSWHHRMCRSQRESRWDKTQLFAQIFGTPVIQRMMGSNTKTALWSHTLLVPRPPIGLWGLPDSPSLLFSPIRWNTWIVTAVNKQQTHVGRAVHTFIKISPGDLIFMGSTCFWVWVGIPWVAKMACNLKINCIILYHNTSASCFDT